MQGRSVRAAPFAQDVRTTRRLAAVIVGAALAMGMLAAPATAAGHPPPDPHPHALLLHAEWEGSGPGTVIHSFERCVDLANGRKLPNHAHHDTVHQGEAGGALHRAGHLVVPFATCADLSDS